MLIKNAHVIDPANKTDDILDILIEDGRISGLGRSLRYTGDEIIDAAGLVAAPGLVDVHTHFRDPGQTDKETLHTGALAAAAGGYTSVVCMANTLPAVDTVNTLSDILDRAAKEKIHIYQTSAVTMGREGREPVAMRELAAAGAAGFTDDGTPIMDEKLVRRAMKEAAALGKVISFHEEDPAYVWQAGVNSGRVSESMGLSGADRKAEYSMIERDLQLALETGATVDIQHVSAAESVDIIRSYKKKDKNGLIHAEATPHHFSLTEDILAEKGSLAKVNPPLRTEADRQAIIEGIKDGTLDLIATDHAPHTAEEKAGEFVKAPSGMIGLETAFALGMTNLVKTGHISIKRLIELMSVNPARLYGLNAGSLSVGAPADIVIFNPDTSWKFTEEDIHSRSKNSPFIGMTLQGKVRYTISAGRYAFP
ncbi:MAG: dihydroorotase [Lachnospiraceae bacterium]|nr:dihydroorotase [Lachnospiraceae bacterium]